MWRGARITLARRHALACGCMSFGSNPCHLGRLLHGIAPERFAEFLIDHGFEQRRVSVFHLVIDQPIPIGAARPGARPQFPVTCFGMSRRESRSFQTPGPNGVGPESR